MTRPKNGPVPKCVDCGTIVSDKRATRCKPCANALRATSAEHLLSRTVRNENGCLIWQGAVQQFHRSPAHRYGRVTFRGKPISAHRALWIAMRGEIPVGLIVCHRCDTPLCINPDHLFLGTQSDNMRDMYAKGRHRRGTPRKPVLTPVEIRRVIELAANGATQRELADRFRVSQGTISNIKNRRFAYEI